jgi:hypothetical protein
MDPTPCIFSISHQQLTFDNVYFNNSKSLHRVNITNPTNYSLHITLNHTIPNCFISFQTNNENFYNIKEGKINL